MIMNLKIISGYKTYKKVAQARKGTMQTWKEM